MADFTQDDLRTWAWVVELMQANAVEDADAHLVAEAVANISSGAGLVNQLPLPVVNLLCAAIETGYATALRDIREGAVAGLGLTDSD